MSNNAFPYEVIGGASIAVYHGAVGAAFPDLDQTPNPAVWSKLGLSGDLNYDGGGGIEIGHPQSITKWRPLGSAGARKAFRQEEDLTVKLKVVDMTLEAYALAMNHNSVTSVAQAGSNPAHKKLGLSRGLPVLTRALLVRLLVSPYGEDWIGQYEIPLAVQTGSPVVQFLKDTPAGLELQFDALADPNATGADEEFGRLIFQTEDPT